MKSKLFPNRPYGVPVTLEFLFTRADCSGGADTCWPWLMKKNRTGYGSIGVKGKDIMVTRLVLGLIRGAPLSDTEVAMHRCDNPSCINPKHLKIGTGSLNQIDAADKRRHYQSRKTHCPAGHKYEWANMVMEQNPQNRPSRRCKICKDRRVRAYAAKYVDVIRARDRARAAKRFEIRRLKKSISKLVVLGNLGISVYK